MPLNTDSYRDNSNPSTISNNADIVKGLRPQKLNCAALNVCGLRRRILYPDFVNLINKYHIFSVCETKLDNFDIIDIPDYEFISQTRKQKFIRRSGGIGAFVHKSLSHKISQIDSDSDYIMWLKLDKTLFATTEDIILGVVYVPPHDSRFHTTDEISLFDVEITTMCINHKYVVLNGDFNARTFNKPDFIDADDYFSQIFNFDNSLLEGLGRVRIFRQYYLLSS